VGGFFSSPNGAIGRMREFASVGAGNWDEYYANLVKQQTELDAKKAKQDLIQNANSDPAAQQSAGVMGNRKYGKAATILAGASLLGGYGEQGMMTARRTLMGA
jgi:hypothetical protein